MTGLPEFRAFSKIPRFSRDIIITEKLDGTNGCVHITEDMYQVLAGSRNRWLTAEHDNYGFYAWVAANTEELKKLGPGTHYGEWWGAGIQRKYGMKEKRFSLFNVSRWNAENVPSCCSVVPVLYEGPFLPGVVEGTLESLKYKGSKAAPGFMNPEGLIIFHTAANQMFKKTIVDDEKAKSSP